MFSISDSVKGWLVKGVIGLACIGAVYANVQILKAKDQRIQDQQAVIAQKNETIKNKDGEIDRLKQEALKKVASDKQTEAVKAEVKQEEAKPVAQKTLAQQYVDNKLDAINKKYSALPQDSQNAQRKATEISLERAKGLWLTYCLQEPKVAACVSN